MAEPTKTTPPEGSSEGYDTRGYFRSIDKDYTLSGPNGTKVAWSPFPYKSAESNSEPILANTNSVTGIDNPSHMIIREYEPKFTVDYLELFKSIVNAGANYLNADSSKDDVIKDLNPITGEQKKDILSIDQKRTAIKGNIAKEVTEKLAAKVIANIIVANASSSLSRSNESILTNPVKFIQNMMAYTSSTPLHTYQVPAFDVPDYVNLNGHGTAWSIGNKGAGIMMDDASGTATSKLMAGISALKKGANLKFPTLPKWEMDDSGVPPVTHTFTLYNYDINALAQNYKFVNSFMQGCQWVQLDTGIQVHSNLYQVTMPGRFNWIMCSIDLKVDYKGMHRSLNSKAQAKFKELVNSSSKNDEGTKNNIIGDNIATGKFPEVYEVTMVIRSLMPHNLNMYLEYIRKDDIVTEVSDSNLSGAANAFTAIGKGIASGTKAGLDAATSVGKDAANIAKNAIDIG